MTRKSARSALLTLLVSGLISAIAGALLLTCDSCGDGAGLFSFGFGTAMILSSWIVASYGARGR